MSALIFENPANVVSFHKVSKFNCFSTMASTDCERSNFISVICFSSFVFRIKIFFLLFFGVSFTNFRQFRHKSPLYSNQIQERRPCDERYRIEEIVSPDRALLAPPHEHLVQETDDPSQQLILIDAADPEPFPFSVRKRVCSVPRRTCSPGLSDITKRSGIPLLFLFVC